MRTVSTTDLTKNPLMPHCEAASSTRKVVNGISGDGRDVNSKDVMAEVIEELIGLGCGITVPVLRKTSGDWAQIEHCKRNKMVFVTCDRTATSRSCWSSTLQKGFLGGRRSSISLHCKSKAQRLRLITFDKPIPEGRVLLSDTFRNLSDELIAMQFSPLKKGQVFCCVLLRHSQDIATCSRSVPNLTASCYTGLCPEKISQAPYDELAHPMYNDMDLSHFFARNGAISSIVRHGHEAVKFLETCVLAGA